MIGIGLVEQSSNDTGMFSVCIIRVVVADSSNCPRLFGVNVSLIYDTLLQW